jgi:hypothetical protein
MLLADMLEEYYTMQDGFWSIVRLKDERVD